MSRDPLHETQADISRLRDEFEKSKHITAAPSATVSSIPAGAISPAPGPAPGPASAAARPT